MLIASWERFLEAISSSADPSRLPLGSNGRSRHHFSLLVPHLHVTAFSVLIPLALEAEKCKPRKEVQRSSIPDVETKDKQGDSIAQHIKLIN